MSKPVVAIVGRQNVGKSTLLNRLAGRQVSIVYDLPGTTRDRIFADVAWEGKEFTVVDTGGLVASPEPGTQASVQAQVDTALREADLIILVTDVMDGLTPLDEDIAARLRKMQKPVLLVVNKVDNARLQAAVPEFYRLGLGEPIPVSAYHREGLHELLSRITGMLPVGAEGKEETTAPGVVKVAIVGRPGVGKSMLLNGLLGTERAIVGEKPGTTRDAIDTPFDFNGANMLLIDTAGIRRRGHIAQGVERFSILRSFRAIDRSDVSLLVLDATELPTAQDTHIAGYIMEACKGVVLLVNKWDLAPGGNVREYRDAIREGFKFIPYAPLLFISAKLKQGLDEIMPAAYAVYQERQKKISNGEVNGVIHQAVSARTPPSISGRRLRVYAASQSGVNPPTFTFTVNNPLLLHFSYRRYLENRLRENFGFTGTPLRLIFKPGGKA